MKTQFPVNDKETRFIYFQKKEKNKKSNHSFQPNNIYTVFKTNQQDSKAAKNLNNIKKKSDLRPATPD